MTPTVKPIVTICAKCDNLLRKGSMSFQKYCKAAPRNIEIDFVSGKPPRGSVPYREASHVNQGNCPNYIQKRTMMRDMLNKVLKRA